MPPLLPAVFRGVVESYHHVWVIILAAEGNKMIRRGHQKSGGGEAGIGERLWNLIWEAEEAGIDAEGALPSDDAAAGGGTRA